MSDLLADDEMVSSGQPGRVRGASGSVPCPDETGFVGEHDGLHTVAGLEFHEDPTDVGLHGRLREKEPLADLGVAQPGGNEHENLGLALSQ